MTNSSPNISQTAVTRVSERPSCRPSPEERQRIQIARWTKILEDRASVLEAAAETHAEEILLTTMGHDPAQISTSGHLSFTRERRVATSQRSLLMSKNSPLIANVRLLH